MYIVSTSLVRNETGVTQACYQRFQQADIGAVVRQRWDLLFLLPQYLALAR